MKKVVSAGPVPTGGAPPLIFDKRRRTAIEPHKKHTFFRLFVSDGSARPNLFIEESTDNRHHRFVQQFEIAKRSNQPKVSHIPKNNKAISVERLPFEKSAQRSKAKRLKQFNCKPNEQMNKRAPSTATFPPKAIGKVLFENDRWHLHPVLTFLSWLAVGYVLFLFNQIDFAFCAVVVAFVMSAMQLDDRRLGRLKICVGEEGVGILRGGKTTSILYRGLDSLLWQRTNHGHLGLDSEKFTKVELVGTSVDGQANAKISFAKDDFVHLFETIRRKSSDAIADKLAAELSTSPRVVWIPGKAIILRDGIEVEVRSGLSKFKEKVLYEQITSMDYKNKFLLITLEDRKRPQIKISSFETNFYPGIQLVRRLVELSKRKQSESVSGSVRI